MNFEYIFKNIYYGELLGREVATNGLIRFPEIPFLDYRYTRAILFDYSNVNPVTVTDNTLYSMTTSTYLTLVNVRGYEFVSRQPWNLADLRFLNIISFDKPQQIDFQQSYIEIAANPINFNLAFILDYE